MIKLKCSQCGKEILRYPSQIHPLCFCSKECRALYYRQKDTIYYENNYAYIILNKNNITKKILFDTEDVEKILKFKWHLHYNKHTDRYDVCTNVPGKHSNKRRYLNQARYIMDCPNNLCIDHINRNPLDNRKQNLRICTHFTNNLNKGNNKSGCVGVCWDKNRNKWHVMFKEKNLGRYDNFEEAVKVRKDAEITYLLNC